MRIEPVHRRLEPGVGDGDAQARVGGRSSTASTTPATGPEVTHTVVPVLMA